MTDALLDTSALISAVDAKDAGALPYDSLHIAALTYAELRLGLVTAKDVTTLRGRIRRIDAIERAFGVGLAFDDECARAYERIVQAAVDHGQRARTNNVDRLIAAVAARNGMPLVTRNAADLRGLEGVVEVVAL